MLFTSLQPFQIYSFQDDAEDPDAVTPLITNIYLEVKNSIRFVYEGGRCLGRKIYKYDVDIITLYISFSFLQFSVGLIIIFPLFRLFQSTNSKSYTQDAFQLLLPIIQATALQAVQDT